MTGYRVLANLRHDGVDYAPGETVELDGKTAAPLLEAGVVEAADPGSDGEKPARRKAQEAAATR